MVSPAAPYPVEVVDLVSSNLVRSTVTEDSLELAPLVVGIGINGVPLAVAVLVTEPAVTSAEVTV